MASKKKQEEARQDAPQDEQKNVAGKKSAKTDSGKEAAVENDTGERKTTRKEKGEKTPTLSEQYKSLKEKHPDAMLLFRSGDFYHTLNEDAKKASDILGITLTKPRAKSQGEYMASFPYHALDTYLPKLIRAGQRVAIADMPANTQEKKQVAEVREVIGKAEVREVIGKAEKKVEETTAKTEVKTEAKAGKKADTPKEGEAQEAKAERHLQSSQQHSPRLVGKPCAIGLRGKAAGAHPQEAAEPIHHVENHAAHGYGAYVGGCSHVARDGYIYQSEERHRDVRHDAGHGNAKNVAVHDAVAPRAIGFLKSFSHILPKGCWLYF